MPEMAMFSQPNARYDDTSDDRSMKIGRRPCQNDRQQGRNPVAFCQSGSRKGPLHWSRSAARNRARASNPAGHRGAARQNRERRKTVQTVMARKEAGALRLRPTARLCGTPWFRSGHCTAELTLLFPADAAFVRPVFPSPVSTSAPRNAPTPPMRRFVFARPDPCGAIVVG